MTAVSNAHEIDHTDDGATTTFHFATTAPLPSYLVAFAVGPFDVRLGATSPVRIRLIATKGNARLGAVALEQTAALVTKLSEYFGLRYPYDKLDIVAVPDFDAGAMENAGLITFRDELLLMDPARASYRARRAQTITIAHELAHQWFGDLVTMKWWNDLWLNEGFATWAEARITDFVRPSFEARLERAAGVSGVMDTDAMRSARAVRQPVSTTSDAMEAFDDITYDKGAAVLSVIEHWIGEGKFEQAVQQYLFAHAWKNATSDDLFQALGAASGRDVASLAASYLDRPGVPNVLVTYHCARGAPGWTESVSAIESPWEPLGQEAPTTGMTLWHVPVAIASKNGTFTLDSTPANPEAKLVQSPCNDWIAPNAGATGYYRYALTEGVWDALFKAWGSLDTATRVAAVQSLWAQVRAGTLSPEVLLRELPALDQETSRLVVELEVDVLDGVGRMLVEDEARPAFRRYVAARMRRTFAASNSPRATRLRARTRRSCAGPSCGRSASWPATTRRSRRLGASRRHGSATLRASTPTSPRTWWGSGRFWQKKGASRGSARRRCPRRRPKTETSPCARSGALATMRCSSTRSTWPSATTRAPRTSPRLCGRRRATGKRCRS